jgi:protein-S-isoprenylcysteine O-methyltransferase Ste14
MLIAPLYAIYWLWAAWTVSWFAAGRWMNKPVKQMPRHRERAHLLVTVAGLLLVFSPTTRLVLWSPSEATGWLLFALAAVSFGFCWWARIVMGRLWAPLVSRTADHRIIDSGPFGIVRHPIYTGLIGAALATAAARGQATALIGVALVALGFLVKARLEERFLRDQLGAEAYGAYARRTPMLIPFGPR